MRAQTAVRIAGVIGFAALGFGSGAQAASAVLDYDGVPKGGDFRTTPYSENDITTTVVRGHYELYDDATGGDSDQAFNLDEENPNSTEDPIPSKVTITADGGKMFNVVSLDVINPADSVGEYTITAIPANVGETGASIPAPIVAGSIDFSDYAPGFQTVAALVITQNSPAPCGPTQLRCSHAFTFDDLTVNVLPEPGATASLFAAGLLLALGRRRAR